MTSLKTKLIDTLKSTGRIDLNQLQALCNAYPTKISTAEKRFREMREPLHKNYQPEVGVEFKDGYINAYVWKGETLKIQKDFCKDCGYFMTHSPQCQKVKELTLFK